MCNEEDEYRRSTFSNKNIKYEWDPEKERTNFKKHGVQFKTAAKVFKDANSLFKVDVKHSTNDEVRYNIIGEVNKILFVVYLVKEDNVVWLISARFANNEEKRRYRNGNGYDDLG